MQPAPPAALQLASRLKQLRQHQSGLTQAELAAAFAKEGKLAPVTVSSWESLKSPKLPPVERLRAYARFFATPRSVEGQPKLLPFNDLTQDEKKECEKLETELLRLRSAASGESPGEQSTFNRSWLFRDGARVTFVCAQLPSSVIGPFGDPENPNYTKLQTYADVDSLTELFGHIRAENPMAEVHFRTPPDVVPDDLTGHLVLLGGVVWNEITGRLFEMANLPISQVKDPPLESGEIFVADIDGKARQFWPKWTDESEKVLAEDVGLLVRVPNPLNANRTLTICSGIHSRGVYGAVRSLTDKELRDGNERYISENFGDAESFGVLMAVKVIKNQTMTPDFNSRDVVLYTWAGDDA
jgi:transcriptional regulator with XRE-family HTH domain